MHVSIKTSLLGHYFEYMGKKMEIKKRQGAQNMLLHDEERSNKYPIYEDENGTHIMSPNDMCMIDELQEMIEAGIDSFKIDGVLQTEDYRVAVTKLYRRAIDLYVENPDQLKMKKKNYLRQLKLFSKIIGRWTRAFSLKKRFIKEGGNNDGGVKTTAFQRLLTVNESL